MEKSISIMDKLLNNPEKVSIEDAKSLYSLAKELSNQTEDLLEEKDK